ncbi:endo alpha-1,4 polygalactosaminidase [Myxococcus sp. K15C18031901]|uniref:endo alpha-1,4 polygalactosaminidase n=1 Tax=Myxococcus dinghuensis TaxID=2906761 RepID=UPI0020A6DD9C|nr:endo alpha-1,4 polygalactosaminidase [Myxococcus dinghuensis]MCP3104036.1 endo alpha-1,4 polygalactosaminidase [Myxococcus dinghuensis]
MRFAVAGWSSLGCVALFACGGSSDSGDGPERSGNAEVLANARTLTCGNLQVESGSIGAGQTVQGLHTQTLSGTQDRWAEYVEFAPGTSITCTYALPADVRAADVVAAELGVNYRGPLKSEMRWLFEAWDYAAGAWVLVGDNTFAQSWKWTATSLALGSPQRFVSGGPVKLRYRTTSSADASLLDLLVVRVQPAATDAGTPGDAGTPPDSGTPGDAGTPSDAGTSTDAGTPVPWEGVSSFTYQLTNYPQGKLDTLANSKFNLAVVELSRDGHSDWFTAAEISALKSRGKQVLAYFEIGAIEEYRPEWSQVPADLKLGPVDGWPDEQYVKYWDERWWPIVKGRIDQALAAGFTGCYLDMVVTYEEIPADAAGTHRADLAKKMVALIARINQYAKARNPAFKVMPQNSPELVDDPAYLPAIDGLGMEDMYWSDDTACSESWCEENRVNAARVRAAGKLVLTVDYATQASHVADAYTRSRAAGFVPYVTVRALDRMTVNAGWDPQ